MATMFLLVGLPGAGKTTRAMAIAREHRALRLSPDEWMIPLFGEPDPGGRRDVLEGRLIWLAAEALALATSVVLDFGFWGRDERSYLRWLARSLGAACVVVHVDVDRATQLQRIEQRQARTPEQTFPVTVADLDRWRLQFEAPDETELAGDEPGAELPGPPAGWGSWSAWAAQRWPSSSGSG